MISPVMLLMENLAPVFPLTMEYSIPTKASVVVAFTRTTVERRDKSSGMDTL